ncbi:MAG: UbiX family flavin prenyltransferase [Planctomycetaceae bacterium]|jgi:4-hydroxy-3-polyprenylbenzoate decarboxylase|nr:UbiX family flavin prenyltransferase [Planctomycetaceae bacterium]
MKIIVGITGASGAVYARRLLDELALGEFELHGVFSKTGSEVMRYECNVSENDFPRASWHKSDDMFSEIASGSNAADCMVVVPCSVNTLSCIANGITNNLLQRAAYVTLKERRRLIVVPREMPFDTICLKNMLKLANAGATVMPASPAFYHSPQTIDDLVGYVVGKILDAMGIGNNVFPAWRKRD